MSEKKNIREYNVGKSNYAEHDIQPWDIFLDYPKLTYWDCDIIKRILREKDGDPRMLDYQKVIHICEERIRQIVEEERLTEICPRHPRENR